MAGDWIKMTHTLPDKPEVLAIAQQLGITRFEVVGRLHIIWRWFDTQTKNGHASSVTGVTLATCLFGDEHGTRFVNSLKNVGWLIEDESGISVPNFDYHISESAKTRGLAGNRKQKQRNNKAKEVTEMSRSERDKSVTREEKRREEVNASAPAGFAVFWDSYPKRKNKGDAEKAWKAIKPDASLQTAILEAVEVAKGSDDWRKEGGKFIPYPASWLRAKGWMDDIVPKVNGSSPAVSSMQRLLGMQVI